VFALEGLSIHRQAMLRACMLNGSALRGAEYEFEKIVKHTAAPDAPASGLARCPMVQVSWCAPNSERGRALSSGLIARDKVACPMQAATKLCDAQHDDWMLVHITVIVKSRERDGWLLEARLSRSQTHMILFHVRP
jgi:hypothetical protein